MACVGYKRKRLLGEGGQGSSWLCEQKSDSKLVVVKEYKDAEDYVFLESQGKPLEVYILRDVLPSHPGILDCIDWGTCNARETLGVMFDYCEGGDLKKFTKSKARRPSEDFIWNVFIQMADALAFLRKYRLLSCLSLCCWRRIIRSSRRELPKLIVFVDFGVDRRLGNLENTPRDWNRVVHGDVKPANIFLRKPYKYGDELPSLVLGDFGVAFVGDELGFGGGTPKYQGPEYPYTCAGTDIWGLGAVIHALAHGRGPMAPMPEAWLPNLKGLFEKEQAKVIEEAMEAWEEDKRSKIPLHLTKQYSKTLDRRMMACLEDLEYRIDSPQVVKIVESGMSRYRNVQGLNGKESKRHEEYEPPEQEKQGHERRGQGRREHERQGDTRQDRDREEEMRACERAREEHERRKQERRAQKRSNRDRRDQGEHFDLEGDQSVGHHRRHRDSHR